MQYLLGNEFNVLKTALHHSITDGYTLSICYIAGTLL